MLPPGARVAARARRRQRATRHAHGHAAAAPTDEHRARSHVPCRPATTVFKQPSDYGTRASRNVQRHRQHDIAHVDITSPGSARGRTRSRSDGPAKNAASRSVGSARPRSVMKFGATRYMLHCSCIQLIYIGYVLQFSASALPPCAREQTDRRVDGQARGERPRHPKHLLLCKLARRRTAQLPELARVLLA
jgi:hypothetical protein